MGKPVSICVTGKSVLLQGTQPRRVTGFPQALELAVQMAGSKPAVSVQVGLDHARLGIMTVEGRGGFLAVPASKRETAVQAWAGAMLHADVAHHVLRWQVLADPQKVLVSCMSRKMIEEVESACRDTGATLVSCRPAVMEAPESVSRLAGTDDSRELTVVWTEEGEPGKRHGAVQLLRFVDRRVVAWWRGWVTHEAHALEVAIERFERATDAGAQARRAPLHWPSVVA